MKDRYDYIVIGAGSSGCALANKLSAEPSRSVLLVEAGPADDSLFVHMPRGIGVIVNPGSKYIWDYQVTPAGNHPPERWYRGRTLGGSSSVNGMVYMRGAPADYDGWAAMGCDGWEWDNVSRTFMAIENHDQGEGATRGAGGPLNITTHPKGDALQEAIVEAGVEMGIPRVADVNEAEATREGGIGYQPTTRYKGKRFSAARAFLEPAKSRSNLDIATETDALRIEFTGKRASGVLLRDKTGTRRVEAAREIVVSAGAFQTPKLLQLSGIGPRAVLEPLGIAVVVDAPDVGRNMREHRHVDLRMRVRGGSQNWSLGGWRAPFTLLRYLLSKKGPMSHAAHEVGAFAKSTPDVDHADLQFGLMTLSASTGKDGGAVGLETYPGITFITYFTRPDSQGELRIQSADPDAPAQISMNHLTTELDRRKFVAAFRWNRRLAAQPALRKWVVEETFPGPSVETDDEILAQAMDLGGTCFHTAGTARMGADEDAVVDSRLRVRGVEGLRVADTSIFPTLVSGNTNGPAMMVGWRAAEFMLEDAAQA